MKNTCIAIIEGWHIYLEGIALLLERQGYHVVLKADSMTELSEQLGGCNNLPDSCIINISCLLKEEAIYQKLRSDYPQMKMVAYSSNEDAPAMGEAMGKGIDTYLLRSDRLEDALAALTPNRKPCAFNK